MKKKCYMYRYIYILSCVTQFFIIFKAVGYNRLPKTKNEDGLVSLFIKKPEEEVRKNQQQIVDALFAIFGSKPQLSVCVEGIKKLPDSL